MSNHPYVQGDTLTPGEMAEDDPFSEKSECHKCREKVVPNPGTGCCPQCGEEIHE